MEGSTKAFCDQLEKRSPNRYGVQPDNHRLACRCRNEDGSDRDDPTEINKSPGLSTKPKRCIICFFQFLLREFNGLALEEMIPLCTNCKHKITHFHLHKRHGTLSPKGKNRHEKENVVKGYPERGRRGRRGRRAIGKCQMDIWRRYRNGDPTVGPLGQPSGKFDYLVDYSLPMSEPVGNPTDPTSYKELFVPTGWEEVESSENSKT